MLSQELVQSLSTKSCFCSVSSLGRSFQSAFVTPSKPPRPPQKMPAFCDKSLQGMLAEVGRLERKLDTLGGSSHLVGA